MASALKIQVVNVVILGKSLGYIISLINSCEFSY